VAFAWLYAASTASALIINAMHAPEATITARSLKSSVFVFCELRLLRPHSKKLQLIRALIYSLSRFYRSISFN
jgi:hypothetical protein